MSDAPPIERAFSSADRDAYRFPYPPFPNGWFVACFANDVAPGEIRAFHRLGRDIAVYRTESGAARVIDPYCPHVGAFLADGKIIGDELQCPFHHWRYGPDGACTFALRATNIPRRAVVHHYPVLERNRLIFFWKHDDGLEPQWDVDVIPELAGDDFREVRRHEWRVRTHPQEMMENSVDVTHFEAVHRWRAKSIDWDCDAHRYTLRIDVDNAGDGYQSATAENADDVVSTNVGPGFSYTRFTGTLRAISLNIMTPTEAGVVYNPQSFWVHRSITDEMGLAWAEGFLADYGDDIPLWERKVYRDQPALSDADGPFARYRRWYAQFYR